MKKFLVFLLFFFTLVTGWAQTWNDVLPKSSPSKLFGLVAYGQMQNGKAINQFNPSKDKGNEGEAWMFSRTGTSMRLVQTHLEGNRSGKASGTISGKTVKMQNGDTFTILLYEDGVLLILDNRGWYRMFQKID